VFGEGFFLADVFAHLDSLMRRGAKRTERAALQLFLVVSGGEGVYRRIIFLLIYWRFRGVEVGGKSSSLVT